MRQVFQKLARIEEAHVSAQRREEIRVQSLSKALQALYDFEKAPGGS